MRYDDGPIVVLTHLEDLEKFISQNSQPGIQKRRQVRLALRALEDQTVYWPYEHITVSIPCLLFDEIQPMPISQSGQNPVGGVVGEDTPPEGHNTWIVGN